MFSALISFITGGARVKVQGLNLDRLLAALLKEGFKLYNLKRPSYQVMVFSVKARQKKALAAALKKQGYKFAFEKDYGAPAALKKLSVRWGLIAGFILCAAGAAVYSGYVWDIRIEGTERIKNSEVTALLSDMGVGGGCKKKDIDRDAVAVTLNTKLEAAADVTVQLKGTSLIIRIYETLIKDGDGAGEIPYSIKAASDAIITKVLVLDGTALVKPGDIVKKGAILIAGYNLDAEGNMTETRAKGEVTGKVFFTAENVFFTEREEYIRTGNFCETRSLTIMGLAVSLKKDINPYALYEKEAETGLIFKGSFIPLRMTREVYYELKPELKTYDYEAAKAGIVSRLKAEAEGKVPAAARVAAAGADIRQIDKYVITLYNIETEMNIALS